MQSTTTLLYTARTSADQSFASSTTPADVTELTLPIEANKTYKFKLFVPISCSSFNTTGLIFQVNTPASPSNFHGILTATPIEFGTTVDSSAPATFTLNAGVSSKTGTQVVVCEGTIENTIDGSITLQIAQHTSSATAITVKRGSTLELYEIL